MFASLGRAAYRWRLAILAVWVVAVLLAAPFLPRVAGPLQVGGFSSLRTEAAQARDLLQRELGFAPSTLLVIFQAESPSLNASDPRFHEAVARSLANVGKLPEVGDIILPAEDASLISGDESTSYAIVGLDLPPEDAQRLVSQFEASLAPQAGLKLSVAGAPVFYRDIEVVS